jgi:MFS family permease
MPILFLTILLSGMGFGLILPGFPFVAIKLGASSAVATTILGLYAVGQVLSTPVWGRFSDRYGRKPLLIISIAGGLVSYLILAFATNGLMGGSLALAMAYVSDLTPPEQRAKSMGYVGGSLSMGFIVGPMLGGLLGGKDAASANLLWPGLAAAGISAVMLIGAVFFLKESLPPEKRSKAGGNKGPGGFAALRLVLARPLLAQIVLVGFMVYLAMALFESIFPFWARARFDWGPRQIGLSFTYLGAIVAIIQGVLVGLLVPIFGEGRLLIAGLVCYIFGLLVMTQAPVWPVMLFGITFTTAGSALYMTTVISLVSQQAGESERGLVLGTYNSGSWAGRALGPPLTGLLFDVFGVNVPLYVAVLILLPCIGILLGIVARAANSR